MSLPLKPGANFILSVDVEDWAQSTWERSLEIRPHAADNLSYLLDILGNHAKTATMFVLGKFAESYPYLVKRIAEDGHEVASHGYGHIEVFKQTPEQFKDDLQRAKRLLEDLTGKPVIGYRAPDFSILAGNLWALSVIAEVGHQYDSSIFPIKHRRYGIDWWPTNPVRVNLPSGNYLLELPLATVTLFGKQFPIAGGGYHRLLPLFIIRWGINRILAQGGVFMSYCHPYELDAAEFKKLGFPIPLLTRLHQGLGRGRFQQKLENILTCYEPTPAYQVALQNQWLDYPISI